MSKSDGEGGKPLAELQAELDAAGAPTDAVPARFKDRVDPNHPVLSVKEQVDALTKAELAVTKKKRDQALADLQRKEEERLLSNGGMLTGDPLKDELVYVTIDLADFAPFIALNNHRYYHGQTYHLPRHIADTLRDQASRTHQHQNEIDGKGIENMFRKPQSRVLSGKAAA